MRILILGGTVFVGRHIAEAALRHGHDLTLFNRGSHPEVLAEVRRVTGDRDGELEALGDETWDVVVDTSGYVPRVVRDATRVLRGRVERYVFVSTVSVYADASTPYQDEDAPLKTLDDPTTEQVTGETYGGLKALCEEEVRAAFPDAHLIVRPGIVVGPHDPTDRFTYWVRRTAERTTVLAPDARDQPVNWIDARDLAAWTIDAAARGVTGTFNTVTPPDRYRFEDLIHTGREVAGSEADVAWVDPEFLREHEVRPFSDLPFWLPRGDDNLFRLSQERAAAEGLATRPLEDSVAGVLAWDREREVEELRAGLSPERERELLHAWHERD